MKKNRKQPGLKCVCAGLVLFGLAERSGLADQFPDDHGDDASTATSLIAGVPSGGTIERFVDHDVWQFLVQDNRQYMVMVTPTTLDDAMVRLLGPDGESLIGIFDSVGAGVAAFHYAHPSGPFTLYVDVSGFVEFTTGDYDIEVWEEVIGDSDLDAMADVWENHHFGNLDLDGSGDQDADGVTDRGEYLAGTHPLLSGDALAVTAFEGVGPQGLLTWRSAPARYYDVKISSEIDGSNWVTIGTGSSMSTSTTQVIGVPFRSGSFYRVQLSP